MLNKPVLSKFPLGRVLMTGGIDELVRNGLDLSPYLKRHSQADWGDGDESDNKLNDQVIEAMEDGHLTARLMSTYTINPATDLKIWIITQWHGEEEGGYITTLLLPSEY